MVGDSPGRKVGFFLISFSSFPSNPPLPLPASSSVRLWPSMASSWQLLLATWLRYGRLGGVGVNSSVFYIA